MTDKRQIRGEKYNVAEIVQKAMESVSGQTFDSTKQHDVAILRQMAQATGAWGFEGQLGKIDFTSTDKAISGVNAYLSRRNQANHARWTNSRRY